MRSLILLFVLGCSRGSASDPPTGGTTAPSSPVVAVADASAVAPVLAIDAGTPLVWQWDDVPDLYPLADLSLERAGTTYVLTLTPGDQHDDHRPVVLRGPTWSVEVARSGDYAGAAMAVDTLGVYVATYSRIAPGCQLAAVDRGTGKLLWNVHLAGIGMIGHSKYSNRVQLRVIGAHPVVYGAEAKRYIEERDPITGALLSSQLLPPERPSPQISENLYRELHLMLANKATYLVKVNDFVARLNMMTNTDHAARGVVFREAVRQLDGRSLHHGAYRLGLQLVDTGSDFEIRAQRRQP